MVPTIFGNWGNHARRSDQAVKPIHALTLGQWHLGLAHNMAAKAPPPLPSAGAVLTFAVVPPPPVRVRR